MRIIYLLLLWCLSLGIQAQVLESDDQIRTYFEKREEQKSSSEKEFADHLWKQNFFVQISVNSSGALMINNDYLGFSDVVFPTELEKKFGSFVDFIDLYPQETIIYLFREHKTLKSDSTTATISKCIQVIKEHNPLRQKQMEKYFSRTESPNPVIIIKPGSSYYETIADRLLEVSPTLPAAPIISNIVIDINNSSFASTLIM